MALCYDVINFNELSLQLIHHLREINSLHKGQQHALMHSARANIPVKVHIDTDNVNIKTK